MPKQSHESKTPRHFYKHTPEIKLRRQLKPFQHQAALDIIAVRRKVWSEVH